MITENLLAVLILLILAVFLHGAMLIVCDKQKDWEKRKRHKELYANGHKRNI